MAEQPKMTEFEMALEAAEKVQTQPKAKVHWPAPGGAGAAYPSPPKGVSPQQQQAQPLPGKLSGATEEKDDRAKNKPPVALIAVAVVLVIVAAAVFYFMKKGGGDGEAPASDETAMEETAAGSPGRVQAPAAAKPAGAPAAAPAAAAGSNPSSGSKPAPTPATTQPTEPAPQKEPEVAKVNQAELDQLVKGISYQDAVGIVGGEGVLFTDTLDGGNRVLVYVWPTEGLVQKTIHVVFINGVLDKVNLME